MWKGKLAKLTSYMLAGFFLMVCIAILLTSLVVGLFLFSQAAQASTASPPQENKSCLTCHGNSSFKVEKNGITYSLYLDATKYLQSRHAQLNCTTCHSELGGVPHQRPVYGSALVKEATGNCSTCHKNVVLQVQESAHAPEASCANCHGDLHYLLLAADPTSPVATANLNQTCTACHQGEVKESYEQSFHGVAFKFGYKKVPGCADCHGTHDIMASSKPASRTNSALLSQTCAKCHGGDPLSPNWAAGKEHVTKENRQEGFPLWITWKIFLYLILFDIIMNGCVILLELWRQFRYLLAKRAGKAAGRGMKV